MRLGPRQSSVARICRPVGRRTGPEEDLAIQLTEGWILGCSRADIRADRHGPHLLHSSAAGRWDVLGARFSRKALSRALASSSLTAIAVIRLSIKSPVSGSARAMRGNAWT